MNKSKRVVRILGLLISIMIAIVLMKWHQGQQTEFSVSAKEIEAVVVKIGSQREAENSQEVFVTLSFLTDKGGIRRSSMWMNMNNLQKGDKISVWFNPMVPPYVLLSKKPAQWVWILVTTMSGLLLIVFLRIFQQRRGKI